MKQILILLLIAFSYNAYSQSAFELLIKSDEDEILTDAIELENNDIIMVGAIGTFHGQHSNYPVFENSYILKINSQGEIISEKYIILEDSCFAIQNILLNNNSEIIIIGTAMRKDIGYANVFVYQKYDLDFNLLMDKRYKAPKHEVDIKIHKTNIISTNLIICGFTHQSKNVGFDLDMFYFKIDEQGDSINSNFFISDEENISMAFDIIEKMDGSGYYSLTIGYPFSDQTAGGHILNMDNDLNVLSYKNIPENIYNNGDLKWFTDTTYIHTGHKYRDGNLNYMRNLGISILDTAHNIISSNNFGVMDTISLAGAYKSLEYNIGDEFIYLCGTYNYDFIAGGPFSYKETHIQFVKTNLELEPVWEKFYKGDACYVVMFFKKTNDGGFLFLSSRYDSETQDHERDIHVLKVDADGNMPTNIENADVEVTELIIYPNPGTNLLQIRTAVQQLGGVFYIYDITGKQIMQQYINTSISQINTSNLPGGTYIYKYINNNKLIETGKWVKK